MELGLIAYVLYASSILIWCSVQDDCVNVNLVSTGLLQQWLGSRSDLIVFELQPERRSGPADHTSEDFLTVTPSELAAMMDWIPPDSTLVFCNRGVSSRAVSQIQKLLALRNVSRVFWLNEAAPGIGARRGRVEMLAE